MRRILAAALCTISCVYALRALPARAQQTTVGTAMNNVGDSFFEGIGVGFNARGPNWFFTNGGSGGAIPQFGGFDPNAGATLGFGFRGPGFSGSMNIGAAQGSTRGMSSTAGSVTVPNGGMGSISDLTLVPFVTSVVPVVGGAVDQSIPHFGMIGPSNSIPKSSLFDERIARLKGGETPTPISSGSSSNGGAASGGQSNSSISSADTAKDPQTQLLASAQQSSAGQSGGGSIAEIRRKQAAEDAKLNQEIQSLFDQARAAKAAGKTGVAKIYYEQAARRATGAQKEEALAAIRALR
jgi:hypothetical protein